MPWHDGGEEEGGEGRGKEGKEGVGWEGEGARVRGWRGMEGPGGGPEQVLYSPESSCWRKGSTAPLNLRLLLPTVVLADLYHPPHLLHTSP